MFTGNHFIEIQIQVLRFEQALNKRLPMKYYSLKPVCFYLWTASYSLTILPFFLPGHRVALPEWQFNRISKYSVTKRSRPTGEIEPFFVFVFLSEMNSFNYVFSTHSVDPSSCHPHTESQVSKHKIISTRFFTPYQQGLKSVRPSSRYIVPCIYTVWVPCPLPAPHWER